VQAPASILCIFHLAYKINNMTNLLLIMTNPAFTSWWICDA